MLIFIGAIGGAAFLYTAPVFEREAPKIAVKNNGYWNLKDPLQITIDDKSGIKAYTVTMKSPEETITLANEQFVQPQNDTKIAVEPPKNAYRFKAKEVIITVEATDASKWNFLNGNAATASVKLTIDKKRPFLSNITNSYAIMKGGSALVVFKAEDANLEEVYIETSFGKRFKPQPFYKEGYYVSLLAWPVTEESFRATVVARDKVGNVARTSVPLRLRDKAYHVSKITLSERFLEGKIAELAREYAETQGVEERIEQFKIINEEVRAKNEKRIHEITSNVSDTMIKSLPIRPFYPLKNGKKVASFGDHRLYHYQGAQVSESYHLGLDLASVKMGAIITQNKGDIVYSDYNGIYGNMPILDHGMGLYTLYGHCSGINVQQGMQVPANSKIANTGMSGYAMGDHLHFGVLVQGVEVRPEEWMDKQWIRLNITEVMESAKKIIDQA